MTKPSGTYSQWADFLTSFGRGETDLRSVPPPLDPDQFGGVTVQKLAERAVQAVQNRLDRWAAVLADELAQCRDPFEVGRCLTQARQGIYSIREFTAHSGFPQDIREKIDTLVTDVVQKTQQQLEIHAQHPEAGHVDEQLLQVVRANPVTTAATAQCTSPTAKVPQSDGRQDPWAAAHGTRKRRTVLTPPQ